MSSSLTAAISDIVAVGRQLDALGLGQAISVRVAILSSAGRCNPP